MAHTRAFKHEYENKAGFTVGELIEVLKLHDSSAKPRARISVAFNSAGGYIQKITITEEGKEHGTQSKDS